MKKSGITQSFSFWNNGFKNRKNFLIAITIFFFNSFACFCQILPDTFKVGDYIEFLDNNEVIIYFNCTGRNVSKESAEYVRWGKLDITEINVCGNFIDFYIDGSVALKANMKSDMLDGPAFYYYSNGQVMMEGKYSKGIKKGIWNYYYEIGSKEKTVNFINGYPYIVDFYNIGGFQRVSNGNGDYKGYFYPAKSCYPFQVKGKIVNGKMDGKWSNGYGTEIFIDGVFQKGYSQSEWFYDSQRIFIEGPNPHENVVLDENFPAPEGVGGIFDALYKGKIFADGFFQDFTDSLYFKLDSVLNDQWFIINFDLNCTDQISHINVRSSINDTISETRIFYIVESMNYFTAFKVEMKKINFSYYFTVYVKNNYIIIPKLFHLNQFIQSNSINLN